jgi:hypothetical protein
MRKFILSLPLILLASSMAFAQHSYWRLYITANSGSTYSSCSAITMTSTYGGSNLSTGGTALSSSNYDGETAANCFAGSSQWTSGESGPPSWIGYEFASPVTISNVVWTPRSGYLQRAPTAYSLEYSDDGTSWSAAVWSGTTAWTVQGSQILGPPPSGTSVSKANAYVALLPLLLGVSVSKAQAYVVLAPATAKVRHSVKVE